MSGFDIQEFLSLDALSLARERSAVPGGKTLFVSLNPDLTTDFGHFLNYERRLKDCSEAAGADYACFAHSDVRVELAGLRAVFPSDSGHYSMMRNGAAAGWRAIAEEFWRSVDGALAVLRRDTRYDRVVLFLYCGSSVLASTQVDRPWAPDVELVINAFWDFLLPAATGSAHISRLSFQQHVRLLAMSELHGDEIFRATGLRFDSIPNPPPLLGDLQALAELRRYGGVLARAPAPELRVLVPGLMTHGKGKEITEALYRQLCASPRAGLRFVFRDRAGVLDRAHPPSVEVLRGDLSDELVKDTYRRADAALIPYDAQTFRVRTSGAIVDCLSFGTVPLVLAGTWLADACERYDFGIVLQDTTPAAVLAAIERLRVDLIRERVRLFRGAVRYLARNSWTALFDTIAGSAPVESFRTTGATAPHQPSVSLLAEANRLVREADYRTAAVLFDWLARSTDLDLYRRNIELCARRSGLSVAELLAREA